MRNVSPVSRFVTENLRGSSEPGVEAEGEGALTVFEEEGDAAGRMVGGAMLPPASALVCVVGFRKLFSRTSLPMASALGLSSRPLSTGMNDKRCGEREGEPGEPGAASNEMRDMVRPSKAEPKEPARRVRR